MPEINIMYTNAYQFTTMKKSELLEFAERKKLKNVKSKIKIPGEQTELCNFWLHFASSKS